MQSTQQKRWLGAEAFLRRDPRLGSIVERVGPCPIEPKSSPSLFVALLRSIIHQQLNGKAAAIIHARVLGALENPRRPTPAGIGAVADETFRAAGLSRAKLAAIRDLAAHAGRRELPDRRQLATLSDGELIDRITIVRGIGPWTVQMLLMFELGRPDVWPVTDFGVRTAVQKLFRKRALPDARFMEKAGRAWRPWRTVASWYLWRSLELPEA